MFDDKLLVWKCKQGNSEAALRIYEKYKKDLLSLATVLLYEKSLAEDVVHSVFVSFAEKVQNFELRGSLKSYLATCVVNRVRNSNNSKRNSNISIQKATEIPSPMPGPEAQVIQREESDNLTKSLKILPYEQQEIILLRLKGGMTFREIAKIQQISINTAQSRYRYGLEKLRSLLNGEVK